MNPFRADRAWNWPGFVHAWIFKLTGKVVVRVETDPVAYKWADYHRDVFWPAQERFLASLRKAGK